MRRYLITWLLFRPQLVFLTKIQQKQNSFIKAFLTRPDVVLDIILAHFLVEFSTNHRSTVLEIYRLYSRVFGSDPVIFTHSLFFDLFSIIFGRQNGEFFTIKFYTLKVRLSFSGTPYFRFSRQRGKSKIFFQILKRWRHLLNLFRQLMSSSSIILTFLKIIFL